MKDFVYGSILKYARKCGVKKVAFFAKPNYGRAKEFCNHLRSKGFVETTVYFEAVDSEDSVLAKYSLGEKHHYTDAFGSNPLKGRITAFVIEV